MKITADTNVLVRAITGDDEQQSKVAQTELANASVVALPLPALCELVWVLSQGYKISAANIAEAVRRLTDGANVVVNRPAVAAGLCLTPAATLPMASSPTKEAGLAERSSSLSIRRR
jgi:predicted nucleic-acid-binding protein